MHESLHALSCTHGHRRTCIRTYTCARGPRRRWRGLRRRCDPPACRALEGLGALCSPACRALCGVLAGLPRSVRLAALNHPCIACSKSNALVRVAIDVLHNFDSMCSSACGVFLRGREEGRKACTYACRLVVGLCVLVFVTCRIARESLRLARPLPRESVRLVSS